VVATTESGPAQAAPEPLSTTADALSIDATRLHRGVWWRRVFTALLLAFVVAAALEVFGVRTHTTKASAGPLEASLEYASANRRGVTSVFHLDVRRRGGFPDDVTVQVSSSYLETLAFRGMDPDPDQASADATHVTWTFTKPTGDRFSMRVDAQIDSATHPGRHRGEAIVRVGDRPPVTLHFTTWVFP
jgi:hypothetical protein